MVSSAERMLAIKLWTSFIHFQWTLIQESAIQGTNGVLGILGARHFYERESARPSGITIEHNRDRRDRSIGAKRSSKLVFSYAEIQVPYENINHGM